MRKVWSNEEIEKLRYLYETKGLGASEIIIDDRTYTAIVLKIKKLKLKHTKTQTRNLKARNNTGEKNGMYGKTGWSLGKNKSNCETIKKAAQKNSKTHKELFRSSKMDTSGEKNGMYGKPSWNKGLTKETNDSIRRGAKKLSKIMKKMYAEMSPSEKQKRNLKLAQAVRKKCKKKNTSIEIAVREYLVGKGLVDGIDFEQNYCDGKFIYDFYVGGKVIECQGDYWHANPKKYNKHNINETQRKNILRDTCKIEYLKCKKIKYCFLWEYDIKYNFDNVKDILKDFLVD